MNARMHLHLASSTPAQPLDQRARQLEGRLPEWYETDVDRVTREQAARASTALLMFVAGVGMVVLGLALYFGWMPPR